MKLVLVFYGLVLEEVTFLLIPSTHRWEYTAMEIRGGLLTSSTQAEVVLICLLAIRAMLRNKRKLFLIIGSCIVHKRSSNDGKLHVL